MLRTLNSLATIIESHDTHRVPLRCVYTSVEHLQDLQRKGVVRLEGGCVGLSPLGWRKVQADADRRRREMPELAYQSKAADKVVRALRSLGGGWHETAEVERIAGVCGKYVRSWLNRLCRDGLVDRALGNSAAPGRFSPNAHIWRLRDV